MMVTMRPLLMMLMLMMQMVLVVVVVVIVLVMVILANGVYQINLFINPPYAHTDLFFVTVTG